MLVVYEVKKILNERLVQFGMIACLFLVGALFAYEIYTHGAYTKEGEYERGIIVSHELANDRQQLNQKMSDHLLQEVYEQCASLFQNPENITDYGDLKPEIIGSTWQRYEALASLLMRCTSPIQAYDPSFLQTIKKEILNVNLIWTARESQLITFLNMQDMESQPLFQKLERKRILEVAQPPAEIKQLQEYEDALGWTVLMKDVWILNVGILVMASIIGSLLFSCEHHYALSSVLYTTKLGRTSDIKAKLLAGMLIITSVFVLCHVLYSYLILLVFTTSGANTLIQYQATYWLSIYPVTNIQAYGWITLMAYGGCMMMLLISAYASRLMKHTYHSMIFSLLILFLPMIMTLPYSILPFDLCNGNYYLLVLSMDTIAQIPLFIYEQQIILCMLMLCTIPCFLYSFYKQYPFLLCMN